MRRSKRRPRFPPRNRARAPDRDRPLRYPITITITSTSTSTSTSTRKRKRKRKKGGRNGKGVGPCDPTPPTHERGFSLAFALRNLGFGLRDHFVEFEDRQEHRDHDA